MLNVKRVIATSTDGKDVWVTPKQAETLNALTELTAGGVAAIQGYIPKTGYIKPPVLNLQILTQFSYDKLIERKRAALESISFADVQPAIQKEPKLNSKTVNELNELFNERKAMVLASIEKTLEGDRSDAHRQGHDRCYAQFSSGFKAHLETEKDVDGIMQPILLNGIPVVESIMVKCLELNRTVVVEGVYKPVNSGAPVLMGNAIDSLLNKRSVGIKTLSLKEDNFGKFVASKQVFLPESVGPNVLAVLNG